MLMRELVRPQPRGSGISAPAHAGEGAGKESDESLAGINHSHQKPKSYVCVL